MNVFLVKAGIVVVSLAVTLYTYYKNTYRRSEYESRSQSSTFTGDRISNCLVCLEEFNFSQQRILNLPCRHKFHENCILQVFRNEPKNGRLCPLCRRAVSEEFLHNISN